ncbi:MAG: replication-relaxation family protein [Planctomycetota bacterium]
MAFQLTHRDEQTLFALHKLPLTSQQLFRLSQTFSRAFPSERVLRRRMKRLEEEEVVRRFYYAFPAAGRNPAYWRLTRQSYRLINGLTGEAPLPKRSFFSPMGVSLHFHTHRVAEVVVEMLVNASKNGFTTNELSVEKSLALQQGEWITPDATLALQTREGRQYRFFIELDTASERVATKQRLPSSIQKKLEFYERYRLTSPDPFRVLFVATSSKQRALNILHFGAGLTNNQSAQSIYAAHLPEVLASSDCLTNSVFYNHRLEPTCLVPAQNRTCKPTIKTRKNRIMAELNEREFEPLVPVIRQLISS